MASRCRVCCVFAMPMRVRRARRWRLELDGARNYAGTAMPRWASGELVVGVRADKLKLNVEQAVTMLEGGDFELVAHVTDKAGKPFAGAKVSAGLESSAICSVDATQA